MILCLFMASGSIAASACSRYNQPSNDYYYDDYGYWYYQPRYEPPTVDSIKFNSANSLTVKASDDDALSNINVEELNASGNTLLNKNITVSGQTTTVSAPLANGARTVIVIISNCHNYTAEKTVSLPAPHHWYYPPHRYHK